MPFPSVWGFFASEFPYRIAHRWEEFDFAKDKEREELFVYVREVYKT